MSTLSRYVSTRTRTAYYGHWRTRALLTLDPSHSRNLLVPPPRTLHPHRHRSSNKNSPLTLSLRIRPSKSRLDLHRYFSTSTSLDTVTTTPSIPLLLTILLGLPLALWTYKCLMMYIFQRKIIYMGYAPIGARRERLGVSLRGRESSSGTGTGVRERGEIVEVPKGVEVEEVRIPSGKGGMLSGIVVMKEGEMDDNSMDAGRTVIVYFQGTCSRSSLIILLSLTQPRLYIH